MTDFILILIAGLILMGIGCPFVEAYSRWKKAMKESDEDVQDR